MTPADAARAVAVGGWIAGLVLILAGCPAAVAAGTAAVVTALAVAGAWRRGAILKAAWQLARLRSRMRKLTALDRT